METISLQSISDAKPAEIIIACEDTDTCPGCGAGYRVGLSKCEYCRRPVSKDNVYYSLGENNAISDATST